MIYDVQLFLFFLDRDKWTSTFTDVQFNDYLIRTKVRKVKAKKIII